MSLWFKEYLCIVRWFKFSDQYITFLFCLHKKIIYWVLITTYSWFCFRHLWVTLQSPPWLMPCKLSHKRHRFLSAPTLRISVPYVTSRNVIFFAQTNYCTNHLIWIKFKSSKMWMENIWFLKSAKKKRVIILGFQWNNLYSNLLQMWQTLPLGQKKRRNNIDSRCFFVFHSPNRTNTQTKWYWRKQKIYHLSLHFKKLCSISWYFNFDLIFWRAKTLGGRSTATFKTFPEHLLGV